MKIIIQNNIPDFSLPLPVFSAIHIADAVGKDGEEFSVSIGLEKKYVLQLKELSLDKSDADLQNHTGDRKRFGEGSYEVWYKRNRIPFYLVHKRSDRLAALVWIGPKPLGAKSAKFGSEKKYKTQNEWHTISCRSYPSFRGKRLMKNFIKFALDIYRMHFPNAMFWLGTDDRNDQMVKLGSDLGFEVDERSSDLPVHWLVMAKK